MEHSTSTPNERVLLITQLAKLSFNHLSVVLTADVFQFLSNHGKHEQTRALRDCRLLERDAAGKANDKYSKPPQHVLAQGRPFRRTLCPPTVHVPGLRDLKNTALGVHTFLNCTPTCSVAMLVL